MMREKLANDPELCQRLIPSWELGCRRLTPGVGYLESFLQPNVKMTNSPITHITGTSIVTESGDKFEVDVVVCATGFDVSNIPFYPIIGQRGTTIAEKWKDEPESYLSHACPDFPNYFIFTGPNSVVGHGSFLTSLSWSGNWMIKWLRKMAAEDIKYIVPKQSATEEFVRYGDKIHKTLTWSGGCRSWYKNNRKDGRVTALFPGSALLFHQMISELRPEDFEIRYRGQNRFRFMGNGFTGFELKEGNDLSYYIEK
jgi:cation diffusion facilitator CzcD-associated flavoprotein CzcO